MTADGDPVTAGAADRAPAPAPAAPHRALVRVAAMPVSLTSAFADWRKSAMDKPSRLEEPGRRRP
ncbi:hypothetical protein [Sphingomonas sp. 28-62-11]|uniref:hypothetical protein n=1 Tax=Sphingomonas sp. 28-62-11 TaxID=1970432 RepID=UPI0035A93133